MPLFICEQCDCVENSALSPSFHSRFRKGFFKPDIEGKALCSECSPTEFHDGTINEDAGKWHGQFPKRKPSEVERLSVINKPGYINHQLISYGTGFMSELSKEQLHNIRAYENDHGITRFIF